MEDMVSIPQVYNSESKNEVNEQVCNSKRSNTLLLKKKRKSTSSREVKKGFKTERLALDLEGSNGFGWAVKEEK